MNPMIIETRRVFVAGQLVEYWESLDQPNPHRGRPGGAPRVVT